MKADLYLYQKDGRHVLYQLDGITPRQFEAVCEVASVFGADFAMDIIMHCDSFEHRSTFVKEAYTRNNGLIVKAVLTPAHQYSYVEY